MTTGHHLDSATGATNPATTPIADRLLRLPDVIRIVGLKRSSIYLGVSVGTFPAPVRLTSRAVAWSERAVQTWVSRRVADHTQLDRPGRDADRLNSKRRQATEGPQMHAASTAGQARLRGA